MGEKTSKRITSRDKIIDGKTIRMWYDGDDLFRVDVWNESGFKIGSYMSWSEFRQAHGGGER